MQIKKQIVKGILLTTAVLLLSGCVSKNVVKMEPSVSKNLNNKTFTFVKRDFPLQPFVMTPMKAMTFGLFGAIGGAFMAMDSSNAIDDFTQTPSYYINTQLSNALQNRYNMRLIKHNKITDETSIEDLIREYPDVDYLIDNSDFRWSVEYYPFHFGKYRVSYIGKLKLIDVKNKIVIAEGYCEDIPEYSQSSPTYDELFDNEAKLLKQITKNRLDGCIDKYLREVI